MTKKTQPIEPPSKKPIGKPPLALTPSLLEEYFWKYLDYCELNKKLPNISGFLVYLHRIENFHMARDTYYQYAQKESYSYTINLINQTLEDTTLNNDTQSNLIRLAYLNNKCGYVNTTRTESKNVTLNVNAEVDSEERTRLIQDLLLKRNSISYPQLEDSEG